MVRGIRNTRETFWSRTMEVDGHVLWPGAVDRDGYGQFYMNHQHIRAHRFAYEDTYGPIPDGFEIDHVCRIKLCQLHLEAVPGPENRRRQGEAVTVCRNNHPYTEETTYVDPRGNRGCRICRREATRRYMSNTPTRKRGSSVVRPRDPTLIDSRHVNLLVPTETMEAMEKLAILDDRSTSQMIRRVLRSYVDSRADEIKPPTRGRPARSSPRGSRE